MIICGITDGKLFPTVFIWFNRYITNKFLSICKFNRNFCINSIVFNTYDIKAYNAKFDSKGNLVVKFMVVNDSYGKINSIPKFKITVKKAKKKTVISYAKAS